MSSSSFSPPPTILISLLLGSISTRLLFTPTWTLVHLLALSSGLPPCEVSVHLLQLLTVLPLGRDKLDSFWSNWTGPIFSLL